MFRNDDLSTEYSTIYNVITATVRLKSFKKKSASCDDKSLQKINHNYTL